MRLVRKISYGSGLQQLILQADGPLPAIEAGQFVNVLPPCGSTLLRRPISICYADAPNGSLTMLVKALGPGSAALCDCRVGESLSVLLPLGHGFSTDLTPGSQALLIGGGVGIAPLLYLGKVLSDKGVKIDFLLGGRSAADIPMQEDYSQFGKLHLATEDGSQGIKGLVTEHPRFSEPADFVYCCGPKPMMLAVAQSVKLRGIPCEVSLENKMACGLGACLCCVENTVNGNQCTCTAGPVFNINQLSWQI